VFTGGSAVADASVAMNTTDTANIINKFLIFNTPKFNLPLNRSGFGLFC
jgi:hypothetical protein